MTQGKYGEPSGSGVVWCATCGEGTVLGLCRSSVAGMTCPNRARFSMIEQLRALADLEAGVDLGAATSPSEKCIQWLERQLSVYWPDPAPDTVAIAPAPDGRPIFEWCRPGDAVHRVTFDYRSRIAWVSLTTRDGETLGEWHFQLTHERGWLALICQVTGDPTAGRQIGLTF